MKHQSRLFETFVNYRKQLTRSIRGIVSAHDIDDILQETFVKTYQAELSQDITYERTYMLKTARNLALNHVSKASAKLNLSIEEVEQDIPEFNTVDIEKQFESKERFLLFCRAIEQLSPEVRRVFVLKKIYSLSQKDIAERLQLSESTVEKHVARGLKLCANYLKSLSEDEAKKTSLKPNATHGEIKIKQDNM